MPDPLFEVEVVTPERALLDGPANAVVLRSSDGDLTVLAGHTPLITDIVPGEVRVEREEGPLRLAIHGGYLQVELTPVGEGTTERRSRATLLAGIAELAEEIDVARAEIARANAEQRVEQLRAQVGPIDAGTERPATPEAIDLAIAEAALLRAQVRLSVAGAQSA